MNCLGRPLLAIIVALFCLQARAQTITPAAAAASAAAAAPTPSQVRGMVTLGQQQEKFGTYAAGANEIRFAGGKGDARPDGITRKADCSSSTTDPECFAIQSLQNSRASPATWFAPNAPQLTGRNAVVTNPEAILGFDPAAAAGASAAVQCRTDTIVTPEVREENHCRVTAPNVASSCSLGVEVEVDPDYVYKCLVRTATNSSTSCSVGQVVTVDSTTTYQCVERLRSAQADTCTVNRIIEVDATTAYRCEERIRSAQNSECSVFRVIEVDANTNYVCINQVREATNTQCAIGQIIEVRADANYQCVEQARSVANAACTVGQVVTIDPRFNYSCTSTPNAVTTNPCRRKLTVECVVNPCGGLSITAAGLPAEASFNVFADWPLSNESLVVLEFIDVGTPAGGGYSYFEFDLNITGTINPGRYIWFSHVESGSYVRINGTYYEYGFTGDVIALQPGVNRVGIFYAPVTTSGEIPRLSFGMRGSYCQAPICTDTWDESECTPFRVRS